LVDFQTLSPDLDAEYEALANQLPALERPLLAFYATEAEWLTADQTHHQRWEAWREAHGDGCIDAYHRAWGRQREICDARQQLRKEFTVAVGRGGSAQSFANKFLRALRKAESWRFKPEQPDPLEALVDDKPIVRLKARGKYEEAAVLDASTQRLAARLASRPAEVQRRRQAREPWAEKKLWIDPDQTPVDDVRCQLVVCLLQEQMIAHSAEVSDFLQRYMRQFTHARTKEEYDLLPKAQQLQGGGERFEAIRKGFAYPEHWKELRPYIARTLRGLSAAAAREAVEQSGPRTGHALARTAPYAVDDIVRFLQVECETDVWTPTRRTLYHWIKEGKIRTVHSGKKVLIPEEGLEQIRALVKEQRHKKALKTYYIETGKEKQNKDPLEAAKKRLQRHRQRGESPEAIANAVRRGRKA
jgi:hypothetical protein